MQAAFTGDADIVYAGFWRRYAALFIDQLILGLCFYAVIAILAVFLGFSGAFPEMSEDHLPAWWLPAYFGAILAYYIAAAMYYSFQESSVHQGTLGKRALGIKVVDAQGRRLTRKHALGRWFAASLSYLTMYIGFLMAAFTERKQALHDIVADTLVTDRWAFTDHPERQKRQLSGCLVALIIGVVGIIPLAGILAAIAIPQYQDYVFRAKVAGAIAAARPLQPAIEEARGRTSHCPENGEGGIREPGAYAGPNVASIEAGPMQDGGACALQVTLRGFDDERLDGKRLWLELDPNKGTWACSSEIAAKYLPRDCRG